MENTYQWRSKNVARFKGKYYPSHLGGIMVSVLAIGPEFRWLKPSQGDGFLRAITIRRTPSS
jgi:hypothetical protein